MSVEMVLDYTRAHVPLRSKALRQWRHSLPPDELKRFTADYKQIDKH